MNRCAEPPDLSGKIAERARRQLRADWRSMENELAATRLRLDVALQTMREATADLDRVIAHLVIEDMAENVEVLVVLRKAVERLKEGCQ